MRAGWVAVCALSVGCGGEVQLPESEGGRTVSTVLYDSGVANLSTTPVPWGTGPRVLKGHRVLCDHRRPSSPDNQLPGSPDILCTLGATKGMLEVQYDVRSETLRTWVVAESVGAVVEAARWPLGHVAAAEAQYGVREGLLPEAAHRAAQAVFSDMVLGARLQAILPAGATLPLRTAVGEARTDAERLAFIHEALGRAAGLSGRPGEGVLLARVLEAFASELRVSGGLPEEVGLTLSDGTRRVWSRELFRFGLALSVLSLGDELGLNPGVVHRWALRINGQGGRLFAFTAAPPL